MDNKIKNMNISISTNTLIKIVLIGALIFALIKLSNIVFIILIAIVVASFVESAVKRLKPYIKNRSVAVFLIYIITIGIIVGLSSVFMPVFIEEMSALVTSLSQYIPNSSLLNGFQPDTITGAKDVVSTISRNASIGDVVKSTKDLIASMSGGFMDIFGGAFGGLVNFFFVTIISFYLSITEKGIENFLRIVTPIDSEEYIIDLWQRTEHKIGRWVQGQMLLGLIIGVLAYLGLTILGVKYSLVLAILTAFCELVPLGIFLAVIPVTLFGYLDGGVTMALLALSGNSVASQYVSLLVATRADCEL